MLRRMLSSKAKMLETNLLLSVPGDAHLGDQYVLSNQSMHLLWCRHGRISEVVKDLGILPTCGEP